MGFRHNGGDVELLIQHSTLPRAVSGNETSPLVP